MTCIRSGRVHDRT